MIGGFALLGGAVLIGMFAARDLVGVALVAGTPTGESMVYGALCLTLAVAATASLTWSKRERRRQRGECEACGYTRAGIDAGAVCPECGAKSGLR